jgi:hypothetical protein
MDNGTLKDPYRHIEANEAEMARFRAHLAQRLPLRRRIPFFAKALVPAALAIAALLVLLPSGRNQGFPQRELTELESLAASASPAVLEKAHELAHGGDDLDRLNACVILCMTEPIDQVAVCVAEGLENDPRAEIRAFYLEQLLERADEYRYNVEMMEELWDQEPDEQCQRLYRDLFRIAT